MLLPLWLLQAASLLCKLMVLFSIHCHLLIASFLSVAFSTQPSGHKIITNSIFSSSFSFFLSKEAKSKTSSFKTNYEALCELCCALFFLPFVSFTLHLHDLTFSSIQQQKNKNLLLFHKTFLPRPHHMLNASSTYQCLEQIHDSIWNFLHHLDIMGILTKTGPIKTKKCDRKSCDWILKWTE